MERSWAFVRQALDSDVQVQTNRRTLYRLLLDALGNESDPVGSLFAFPIDQYDKLLTFCQSTDPQVHYADASHTVQIYSFTKILMNMRRLIMKRGGVLMAGVHSPTPSPRASPNNSPLGPRPLQPVQVVDSSLDIDLNRVPLASRNILPDLTNENRFSE